MMGSAAYGCSTDMSDRDIYGFGIPPKDIIFPHLAGKVHGFDRKIKVFEQYQKHHIKDGDINYDMSIYNIVKYFRLVADNNPNMVDSLFVPRNCVIYSNKIGEMVRENRQLFLCKKSWHAFKGYAYSQLHKMKHKRINEFIKLCDEYGFDYDIVGADIITLKEGSGIRKEKLNSDMEKLSQLIKEVDKDGTRTKRLPSIAKHGYDVKFAYHVVRLINEVEQILEEGDLDLQKSKEQLKSIRRGEWSVEKVEDYFNRKEKQLEELYHKSKLPHKPRESEIKALLLNCLEEHYGSLDKVIVNENKLLINMRKIHELSEV
jgi:predicted nucleotidyltransferase